MLNRADYKLVGGMSDNATPIPQVRISPLNTQMKPIGMTHSQWDMAPVFQSAFRSHGQLLNNRLSHQQLPTVPSGSQSGLVYAAGIKNAYEYLKNPRGADGTVMMDNSSGNMNMVEKRF